VRGIKGRKRAGDACSGGRLRWECEKVALKLAARVEN